jgi:hypothetical protein
MDDTYAPELNREGSIPVPVRSRTPDVQFAGGDISSLFTVVSRRINTINTLTGYNGLMGLSSTQLYRLYSNAYRT